MPFTAGELASIANAALKFYIDRGKLHDQTIQSKPLVAMIENKKKTFPGGDGTLSLGVKGVYGAGGTDDGFAGYTHDDTVGFYTPENIMRAEYDWREHHIGFTMTHTELKMDGLSVVDTDGENTEGHTAREKTVLKGMLENKLEDFAEMRARSLNALLWGDGTADAKALAGLRSIIVDNPTVGTVGGIDAAINTWWRNRAHTAAHAAAGGTGAVTSNPANGGALWEVLQSEHRQLTRYGARPDTFVAGSDFIAALEREMKANGNYTQTGFTGGGDGSIGQMKFKNMTVMYDPTLDDDGDAKRAYIWDSKDIALYAMDKEWNKQHTPSRPADKFVLYRSVTSTGQMVCRRRNGAMVIDIA
jgi:hypothetical protein